MDLNANVKTLSDRDLTEFIWALQDRIREAENEQRSREAARLAVEPWDSLTPGRGEEADDNF